MAKRDLSHDDLNDDPPPDNTDTGEQGGEEPEQFDLAEHLDSAYDSMADDGSGDLPDEPKDQGEAKGKAGQQAGKGKPEEGDETDQSGQQQAGKGEGDQAGTEGEGAGDKGGQGQEGKQGGEEGKDEDLELTEEERAQLSERASQRFDKLVDRVKTESQEKEQYQQQLEDVQSRYNAVAETLQQTNATPDQLGQILDMTGELMSGDVNRGQQGVQRAYAMVKEYARFYGVKLPETNLLDDHPDLQQQVEQGQMTQDIAEQHASMRNQQRAQSTVQRNQQQSTQQMHQLQAEANQAAQQLGQLHNQWQQSDPDFQNKAPLLHEYANQLAQEVMDGQRRPSEAVKLMQERYDTISKAMKTAAQTQRQAQGSQEPNPIRPGPRRGGKQKQNFKSIEEAVMGTYDEM